MSTYTWQSHPYLTGCWIYLHKDGHPTTDFSICIRPWSDGTWRVEVFKAYDKFDTAEIFELPKSMPLDDVRAYAVVRWRINSEVKH
jgi:hypothetical protein